MTSPHEDRIIERLEPDILARIDPELTAVSIAISLKRIARALEVANNISMGGTAPGFVRGNFGGAGGNSKDSGQHGGGPGR